MFNNLDHFQCPYYKKVEIINKLIFFKLFIKTVEFCVFSTVIILIENLQDLNSLKQLINHDLLRYGRILSKYDRARGKSR